MNQSGPGMFAFTVCVCRFKLYTCTNAVKRVGGVCSKILCDSMTLFLESYWFFVLEFFNHTWEIYVQTICVWVRSTKIDTYISESRSSTLQIHMQPGWDHPHGIVYCYG